MQPLLAPHMSPLRISYEGAAAPSCIPRDYAYKLETVRDWLFAQSK